MHNWITLATPRWRTASLIVLLAATFTGAMWWASLRDMQQEARIVIESAYRENMNLAVTLAEHNANELEAVERRLQAFDIALAAGKTPEEASAEIVGDGVMRFTVAGRDGISRSADPALPGEFDVRDRDYFQYLSTHRTRELFVGRLVEGRLSGRRMVIPVAWRREAPTGEFLGIVVAAVSPDFFNQLYGRAQLGKHGSVSLVGTDGFVRARQETAKLAARQDLRGSTLMQQQAGRLEGQFRSTGMIDGIIRYVSYARIARYPSLMVVVGRGEDDVLLAHREHKRTVVGVLTLATLVVAMLAALAIVGLDRQRRNVLALGRSERKYRAIFDNALEGIFQAAPDGTLLAANAAMARISGHDSAPAFLERARDMHALYLHPGRHKEFERGMREDGIVSDFQFELARPDGSTIWVSKTARAVRDDDGRVTHYEGFVTDVTARKREELLREEAAAFALRRYREMLDRLQALAGKLAHAPHLPAIYRAVLEFARDSAPVDAFAVSIYDAQRAERRCAYAWQQGGEPQVATLPHLPMTNGGHCRAIAGNQVVVIPEFDAARDAAGFHARSEAAVGSALIVPMSVMRRVVGTLELQCGERDAYREDHVVALHVAASLAAAAMDNARLLSEERGHRSRAEEAERRITAVLDSALDGVVTIDADDRIIDFNPAAERLFGVARAHAIGMRLGELVIPPEMRARHRIALANHVRTGRASLLGGRVEMNAMRCDGTLFPAEISVVSVAGSDPPLFTGFVRDITPRRQAEAALRESEARHRHAAIQLAHIMDGTMDVICRFDRAGRFVHVSAACAQIWGRTVEELVGCDVFELVHPEDIDATRDAMCNVVAGHPTRSFENRHRRADGTYANLMWSARWVEDEQAMICVARDVSEVKLMTAANELLAQRLRETLEALSSGFVTIDREWRLTYVNRAAEAMASQPRERMVGCTLWQAIPGMTGTSFEAAYLAAMADRLPRQVEDFHAAYGRWFEVRIHPLADGGLAGFVDDVSARHEAQERLAASEQRFEHVARATSDAIWDWDAGSERIWWSEGMMGLFGHDPTSAVGTVQGWTDCIHPDDRARVRQEVRQAIKGTGLRFSSEYRVRQGDGSYAVVAAHGTIVRDAQGRASRMLGGVSDVTERRDLERQVMRSQRLDSLGTMAGGIAHDLNNVFTPIIMGLNLLSIEEIAEEQRPVLETIRISANRGAQMVKQVLSFARGLEGQKVEVQPSLVMKELEGLVRETFPRNIEIRVDSEPRMPTVVADPTQLHQVLLNLCLNARDAMADGGRLFIGVRPMRNVAADRSVSGEIPPGEYVRFDVEDSGCGMSDATLERIFEPFFTTKPHGEGTGLGLPTALTIVGKHRGHMQVSSRQGCGTRFTVLLPVAEAKVSQNPPPTDGCTPGGNGETVLVVDDEDGIRELAARTLTGAGYQVVTARDGRDALARWRSDRKVDLVFTDLMMPVMDGGALMAELRRLDPSVRVLCSSGLAAQAEACKVERFLAKPYSRESLLVAVREALAA